MGGRRGKIQTVERGIYRDRYGYEVVARAGKRQERVRFDADTPLEEMRRWRDTAAAGLREEAPPTRDAGTLTAGIERYIATTRLPTDHAYRPSLNAWIAAHGTLPRRKLTGALALQTLERWKHDGYSPQSLYYRRLVIEKVWKTLDGPKAKTPVDDIHIKRPKGRRPVWVRDNTILEVLMNLRRQEMAGRLRTAKTRARFLVLATCGQRPAQMKLAQKGDVEFWREPVDGIYGVWNVRAAKNGEPVPRYLNEEQATAWRAFVIANAWGWYDTRSFARTIHHAGWPKGIRVYNARHATGITLSASGVDLGDIQAHMGHTSISTTRQFYVPELDERQQEVARKLQGRFSGRSVVAERSSRPKS